MRSSMTQLAVFPVVSENCPLASKGRGQLKDNGIDASVHRCPAGVRGEGWWPNRHLSEVINANPQSSGIATREVAQGKGA